LKRSARMFFIFALPLSEQDCAYLFSHLLLHVSVAVTECTDLCNSGKVHDRTFCSLKSRLGEGRRGAAAYITLLRYFFLFCHLFHTFKFVRHLILCPCYRNTVCPVAQSVLRLATGWTVRGSNAGWGEIFRTCPDRLCCPSSLLYNEYRFFPRGKERPRRDADSSPLLVPGS
jgi:hypothetical protein